MGSRFSNMDTSAFNKYLGNNNLRSSGTGGNTYPIDEPYYGKRDDDVSRDALLDKYSESDEDDKDDKKVFNSNDNSNSNAYPIDNHRRVSSDGEQSDE